MDENALKTQELRSASELRSTSKSRTPAILTQTFDAALSNGELDQQAFLKAWQFEIEALEDGMRRSKSAVTSRAFQQVPREMRRRAASHNVKRVPKRLQSIPPVDFVGLSRVSHCNFVDVGCSARSLAR
jgi:hypothetical protein